MRKCRELGHEHEQHYKLACAAESKLLLGAPHKMRYIPAESPCVMIKWAGLSDHNHGL